MVDGKVGFHCPQLMVLEGGPHSFGLLCWRVGLLVPVQVIGVIFVTALEGTERGTWGAMSLDSTTARLKANSYNHVFFLLVFFVLYYCAHFFFK